MKTIDLGTYYQLEKYTNLDEYGEEGLNENMGKN